MESKQVLVALAIKNKGNWDSIYKAIVAKAYPEEEEVEKLISSLGNTKYITMLDKEYPEEFKRTCKPPFVLFYEGDIELLNSKFILGVASIKEQIWEDKNIAEQIVATDERIVFSIGCKGNIDLDLVKSNHKVIGVIPCSLDDTNQRSKYKSSYGCDLVITEIPNGAEMTTDSCVLRQRIIAGISRKVLVVSAKSRSGAMALINNILQQNKDLLVVPTNPFTELVNNSLISQGAICIYDKLSLQLELQ